jgi:hypothetical protein
LAEKIFLEKRPTEKLRSEETHNNSWNQHHGCYACAKYFLFLPDSVGYEKFFGNVTSPGNMNPTNILEIYFYSEI